MIVYDSLNEHMETIDEVNVRALVHYGKQAARAIHTGVRAYDTADRIYHTGKSIYHDVKNKNYGNAALNGISLASELPYHANNIERGINNIRANQYYYKNPQE